MSWDTRFCNRTCPKILKTGAITPHPVGAIFLRWCFWHPTRRCWDLNPELRCCTPVPYRIWLQRQMRVMGFEPMISIFGPRSHVNERCNPISRSATELHPRNLKYNSNPQENESIWRLYHCQFLSLSLSWRLFRALTDYKNIEYVQNSQSVNQQ